MGHLANDILNKLLQIYPKMEYRQFSNRDGGFLDYDYEDEKLAGLESFELQIAQDTITYDSINVLFIIGRKEILKKFPLSLDSLPNIQSYIDKFMLDRGLEVSWLKESNFIKIKRIKRLIESLNPSEIKELNTLLEAPFPKNSEYGKGVPSEVLEGRVNQLDVWSIARRIQEGKIKETKELLMRKDAEDGWSTAHELAIHSDETGWATYDKEILMMQTDYGYSVAHCLAFKSSTTNWSTTDKEILMIQNKWGFSVAHELASWNSTWTTDDPEILGLYNSRKDQSVEDVLRDEGKI